MVWQMLRFALHQSHINLAKLLGSGLVEAPDFFEFGEDRFRSESRFGRAMKVEHDLAADHHDETISKRRRLLHRISDHHRGEFVLCD